jgi:hypothetical protein
MKTHPRSALVLIPGWIVSIEQQSRFDRTIQTEDFRTSLSQTKLRNVSFKVLMVGFLAEA